MDDTDDPISAFPGTPLPPPLPPGLPPETVYLGSMIQWSGHTQAAEMRRGLRRLGAKIDDLKAGVADVAEDVATLPKAPPESVLGKLAAYVAESPMVKQAIALAVATFIGVGTAGLTAYFSLRVTGGVASPAQIVTGAEPTPAAPVTVITSASAGEPQQEEDDDEAILQGTPE